MPRPASARRDEEEYRQYSTPVGNGPTQTASGCSAARMQRDFCHGLLMHHRQTELLETGQTDILIPGDDQMRELVGTEMDRETLCGAARLRPSKRIRR